MAFIKQTFMPAIGMYYNIMLARPEDVIREYELLDILILVEAWQLYLSNFIVLSIKQSQLPGQNWAGSQEILSHTTTANLQHNF